MKRTQMYLDDELWSVLHTLAQRQGTTVSDLVRQAARERYLGKADERRRAMEAFIGIRKDRSDAVDSTEEVRQLRKGTRLERL